LARWVPANKWLLEGLSPYDERVSLETQRLIYGHPADVEAGEDKNHFVYPMYSMVFFGPLGLLDYTVARAVWMTVLEVAAVAVVFLGLRLADWRPSVWMTVLLILFALLWYHGVRTVVVGQFAGLNALIITLSLLWIVREQDVPAGIGLALATAKPQMVFLLVPFVLLWAYSVRRFRIVTAFLGTFAVLVLVSYALVPGWPVQMAAQMLEYPTYTHIGSPLSVIAAAAPGIEGTLNRVLHAVAYLYVLVQWVLAWGKDERWFLWTALMTLVITNLTAFRTATTNFVVLVPVLLLVFRVWEGRWRGFGRVFTLVSLLLLGVGLWLIFLGTVSGNTESAAMYLPLPVFCLVTLWWARWWAVRQPRLLLEEFAHRLG
ncbi:MAG TPA: glycosyltransferase family 87 protein, partial [Anaerolineales bacterium]|nr:glycosyltransferase family 87 protein [Anaerolineales bacterium]